MRLLKSVSFSKDEVKEIRKSKTVWQQFEEKKKALPKNASAADYLALADWCSDNALPHLEKDMLKSALETAPNDPAVRKRLGYMKDDKGNWVLEEEYYKAKGYVKHNGRWISKEDWTQGCIAVSNMAIDEIWDYTRDGTPVEILP